jgi:hypothetical protein
MPLALVDTGTNQGAIMQTTPKVTAKNNSGLQDDHDPSDLAQKSQQEGPAAYAPHEDTPQGVIRDERGQEQPVDKKRAQQTSSTKKQSAPPDGE